MGEGMEQQASTSVGLAVSDKRAHRPGGCVGIFFQLFDWNRRLAKKKFFSTKLLPPARAKQATKKFAGDEKMPKTKPHLIADENSGGFPANNKKASNNRCLTEFQKQEMRSPSLVAKLMGLDSMPAVQRDKHKKASDQTFNDGSGPLADLSSDKVSTKLESRPQKLQKTGQCDSRAVVTTRLGAEALHIRNVLSRSRKHSNNPPAKLATPVKSPKLSSARHASRTSRLIDAATRILEPGLQATHRAKSAIAYSNSRRYAPGDEVLEGVLGQSVKEVQKSNVTSCKNCGNVVDVVVESRSHMVEEEPFQYRAAASLASHFATPYTGQGRDVACKRKQGQQCSDGDKQEKARACGSEVVLEGKAMTHEFGGRGQSRGFQHGSNHQRDDETSAAVAFKQRSHGQNRMPVVGNDRLMQGSKLSSFSGTKDFVAINRSLSGRSRARVSNRMDNPTFNIERKFCNRRDDVLPQLRSPVGKRKTVSVKSQLQSTGHSSSPMLPVRQRKINFEAVNGKEIGMNPFRARTRFDSQGEGNIANKGSSNGLASFTFNTPSRVQTGYDSRSQMGRSTSNQRNLVTDESERKRCVQKHVFRGRDELGSLIEQKLQELISQEQDELKVGNGVPIRPTAMILQELIAALTIEQPASPRHCFPIANTTFQNGRNHLSPGSVLDASFSNESCFSSSLDENSGTNTEHPVFQVTTFLGSRTQTVLILSNNATASSMLAWDSTTTSTTEGKTFPELVTDLHDHISRILQSITLAGGCQLTSRDLGHAKETILTAELLFGAATHHDPIRTRSSVLGSFLLDELNAVAASMGSNPGSKEASNQLRRLLFDCVVEWLGSRCSRYCDTGFRTWRQQMLVPWCKETVMEEVGEEVKRWTNMVVLIPDEMVELEMGRSLAKWTEFEADSYELGDQIGWEIVEALLEETVREL